ncbi:MAG TPA: sugar ABC transporter permease [Candidatus Mediterraneibacter norfolkensis]|nr:sugar ABC transporter permease [Candidatus Mediterraneibacter norfolkensis]
MKKVRKKKRNPAWIYIAPWIAGFLIFQLYPLAASLFYSFTDYSIVKPAVFTGLDNYIELFTQDTEFIASFASTFKYVLIAVPLKMVFALLVAMLLAKGIKGINVFRTMYYLPSIMGGSVGIAIVWKALFMGNGGILNSILAVFGIEGVNWLGSPEYAIYTLILLTVWQFGATMVIFLAALQQVPGELYEVARVEGANKIQTFFKVTLPSISSIIQFNLIMVIISTFQDFTGPSIVTNGGPLESTYFVALKLYTDAFSYQKMGYACALSWVLFAVIIAITAIIFKTSKYWVHYSDGGDSFV